MKSCVALQTTRKFPIIQNLLSIPLTLTIVVISQRLITYPKHHRIDSSRPFNWFLPLKFTSLLAFALIRDCLKLVPRSFLFLKAFPNKRIKYQLPISIFFERCNLQ